MRKILLISALILLGQTADAAHPTRMESYYKDKQAAIICKVDGVSKFIDYAPKKIFPDDYKTCWLVFDDGQVSVETDLAVLDYYYAACYISSWHYDQDAKPCALDVSGFYAESNSHMGLPGWNRLVLKPYKNADRQSILLSGFTDLISHLKEDDAKVEAEKNRVKAEAEIIKIQEEDEKFYAIFSELINTEEYEKADDLRLEWIEMLQRMDVKYLPSKYATRLNKLNKMSDLNNSILMRLRRQYVASINAGKVDDAERWQKMIITEENKNKPQSETAVARQQDVHVDVKNTQSAIPGKIVIEQKKRHTFKEGGEAAITLLGGKVSPKESSGLTLADILFDR